MRNYATTGNNYSTSAVTYAGLVNTIRQLKRIPCRKPEIRVHPLNYYLFANLIENELKESAAYITEPRWRIDHAHGIPIITDESVPVTTFDASLFDGWNPFPELGDESWVRAAVGELRRRVFPLLGRPCAHYYRDAGKSEPIVLEDKFLD